MDQEALKNSVPETPAFIYDEEYILSQLRILAKLRGSSQLKLLYSIKSFPFAGVLRLVQPGVDGFSVSSVFEARLASKFIRGGEIHITTPGLRHGEMDEIVRLCDHVNFNSLEQYQRFSPGISSSVQIGLRVNPQLSFLKDPRFDPCRRFSKLGVPLRRLKAIPSDDKLWRGIHGLHFHTLFESSSFDPLLQTVERLEKEIPHVLDKCRWINLGGGYLFDTWKQLSPLAEISTRLRERWGLKVYFEPGKAIMGKAGYLIASVIDLFKSDGRVVAILDTSVNHLPEVFEYQSAPTLASECLPGSNRVLMAGCTCLSGDVFGEYNLKQPLSLGDRIVFSNVGAYSLVKASRFNGYNLPTVYAQHGEGKVTLKKQYDYREYYTQWVEEGIDNE